MKEMKKDTKDTISSQSVKQQESSKSEKENLTKSEKLSEEPSSAVLGQKENPDIKQSDLPESINMILKLLMEKKIVMMKYPVKAKRKVQYLVQTKSKSIQVGFKTKRDFYLSQP